MNQKQVVRKIEKVRQILWFIEAIWFMYPDLRLGQLLQSFGGFTRGDNFHLEDDKILENLKENYKDLIIQRNKQ